jgi:type IV pilus assembly protein PilB
MGAKPYLLASSLRTIVAQRLLRRCCRSCFEPGLNDSERSAAAALGVKVPRSAGRGTGCEQCDHTGFLGRVAVAEVLLLSEEVKEDILIGRPESYLIATAREQGFRTMLEQALDLVKNGHTTAGEVLRQAVL